MPDLHVLKKKNNFTYLIIALKSCIDSLIYSISFQMFLFYFIFVATVSARTLQNTSHRPAILQSFPLIAINEEIIEDVAQNKADIHYQLIPESYPMPDMSSPEIDQKVQNMENIIANSSSLSAVNITLPDGTNFTADLSKCKFRDNIDIATCVEIIILQNYAHQLVLKQEHVNNNMKDVDAGMERPVYQSNMHHYGSCSIGFIHVIILILDVVICIFIASVWSRKLWIFLHRKNTTEYKRGQELQEMQKLNTTQI